MTADEPTTQPAPAVERARRPIVPAILALVAIAAVGAAGYVILRVRDHLQARAFVSLHGGTVEWNVGESTWRVGGETDVSLFKRNSWGFEFHGSPLQPDDLGRLADLHRVVRLDLSSVEAATPAALAVLRELPHLRELDLSRRVKRDGTTFGPLVDGGVFDSLAGLSELTELRLAGQNVSDADLDRIANLSKLDLLDLSGTPITDAGLARLARLPKLLTLDLSDTRVTNGAVATFLEQRPGVSVLAPTGNPAPESTQ